MRMIIAFQKRSFLKPKQIKTQGKCVFAVRNSLCANKSFEVRNSLCTNKSFEVDIMTSFQFNSRCTSCVTLL